MSIVRAADSVPKTNESTRLIPASSIRLAVVPLAEPMISSVIAAGFHRREDTPQFQNPRLLMMQEIVESERYRTA